MYRLTVAARVRVASILKPSRRALAAIGLIPLFAKLKALALLAACVWLSPTAAQAEPGFFDWDFHKPTNGFAVGGASVHGGHDIIAKLPGFISFSGYASAEAKVELQAGNSEHVAIGTWPNTTSITFGMGVRVEGPGFIAFRGNGNSTVSSGGAFETYAKAQNGGSVSFGRNGPSMRPYGSFFGTSLFTVIPVGSGTYSLNVSDHTYVNIEATARTSTPIAHATARSDTSWSASFHRQPSRSNGHQTVTGSGASRDYIVHGMNSNADEKWVQELQFALLQSPDQVVVAFDWREDARTSIFLPQYALNRAWGQGEVLGRQIVEDIQNGADPSSIRLIGHSYGCAVIEMAAHYVLRETGHKIGSAVLLDMPQSRNSIDVNGGLSIKGFRSSAFGFVHNVYFDESTAAGGRLATSEGNVANIRINVEHATSGEPLIHNRIPPYFRQIIELPDSYIKYRQAGDYQETDVLGQVERHASPAPLPTQPIVLETESITWDTYNSTLTDDGAILTESSPALLTAFLQIPHDAHYLRFTYEFPSEGDGDSLSLHFNDDQLFFTLVESTEPGEPLESPFIDISHLSGQSGALSVILASEGNPDASAIVGGFRFFTIPEPSTLALAAIGAVAIFVIWSRAGRPRRGS